MLENHMRRKLLIIAFASALLAACTGPGAGLTGNDTGGIITWSPENQLAAHDWAAEHCARYGKYARITSVHATYGDYIGFSCQFDPRKRPPG
jgi:outer membrane biogenesis lipoprotein LolB